MFRWNKNGAPIIVGLLLAFPTGALAHHISMSFSDWELKSDSARVIYRLPLADAVWIMDPNLVYKQEVMIQINVPVDEALRARVRDYLISNLPQKITVGGCSFSGQMKVLFENANVQLEADLACQPDYLKRFSLANRFLVDENRLHTSFATLHFPDWIQQCLFRSGQFTCEAKAGWSETNAAPAWQAGLLPWWDYLALGLVLLVLAGESRTLARVLTVLILGHAVAPLALRFNLPVPSWVLLRPVLAGVTIYGGILAWSAGQEHRPRLKVFLLAGLILMLALSAAEFLRLSPWVVLGLALLMMSVPENSSRFNRESALYLLALTFGLVNGFILLRAGADFHPRPISLALLSAAIILAWPLRRRVLQFRLQIWTGFLVLLGGVMVFTLRSMVLSLNSFHYENARELLSNLVQSPEMGRTFLFLALILAVVIGGLHALTPGHGKTIVAAYLVGTRGRTLDAILLGLIVTLTHTGSVILLAGLALFASRYLLPDQLIPWLSLASGVLILGLGVYLFQSRLRHYFRFGSAVPSGVSHEHDHEHAHEHEHKHHHHHPHAGGTIFSAHDASHDHARPSSQVTLAGLVALGVTGGIVPCPDALAVLLIAVSLKRLLFGLAVILAFSLGLAAVLIAIGIVMVKARPLLDRFTGEGRFTQVWLPLASAVLVALLGAGMVWKSWP